MNKPKRDNRHRKYHFDEDDMFSHSHDKEAESPSFPYWKPVWNGESWEFQNAEGKPFDHTRLQSKLFPSFTKHLKDAMVYHHSPVFFVDWSKKILYLMSCELYVETEKNLLALVPENLPPKEHTAAMKQVDRDVESTVQKFFDSFKG